MTVPSTRTLKLLASVAVVFGILTIVSGGRALFGGTEARLAVGDAVPFVLWFNFLAGFAYVIAGVGLLLHIRPAVWLSIAILVLTIFVALAFAIHIQQGGTYELRTVGAMILRICVWSIIAIAAWWKIEK